MIPPPFNTPDYSTNFQTYFYVTLPYSFIDIRDRASEYDHNEDEQEDWVIGMCIFYTLLNYSEFPGSSIMQFLHIALATCKYFLQVRSSCNFCNNSVQERTVAIFATVRFFRTVQPVPNWNIFNLYIFCTFSLFVYTLSIFLVFLPQNPCLTALPSHHISLMTNPSGTKNSHKTSSALVDPR